MAALLEALATTESSWLTASTPSSYPEAMAHLGDFAAYKKSLKRGWVKERQELAALYSNIQTKLRTYGLKAWEPKEGLRLEVSAHIMRSLVRFLTLLPGPREEMGWFPDSRSEAESDYQRQTSRVSDLLLSSADVSGSKKLYGRISLELRKTSC
jgi:hypothetical protein